MKWTADKLAELRRLADAGYTSKLAAADMGVPVASARQAAKRARISFHGRGGKIAGVEPVDKVCKRWRSLIGPMKVALRREIERDTAADVLCETGARR